MSNTPRLPDSSPSVTPSDSEPWSIGRVLGWAAEDFARRKNPSPRLDAELLLGLVLGVDRIRLIVDAARPLTDAELSKFRELIKRRRRGEPIAYIRGEREFFGSPFRVDSRVLVPRPDTETLVEVGLGRTLARALYGRALDLCTGSGCVAIAFARERPTWKVTATDTSSDALDLARENAQRLGVVCSTSFRKSDLFMDVRPDEQFELILGNPPYIPSAEIARLDADVRDFEPRLALDGGPDGLQLVRRIIEQAPAHLSPAGTLALEIGHDQAERVVAIFKARGFDQIESRRDYGSIERVVSGVWPNRR